MGLPLWFDQLGDWSPEDVSDEEIQWMLSRRPLTAVTEARRDRIPDVPESLVSRLPLQQKAGRSHSSCLGTLSSRTDTMHARLEPNNWVLNAAARPVQPGSV